MLSGFTYFRKYKIDVTDDFKFIGYEFDTTGMKRTAVWNVQKVKKQLCKIRIVGTTRARRRDWSRRS